MIIIKIFGKQDCDSCHSTQEKFELFLKKWDKKTDVKIKFFDLDTVEGLTHGAMLDATEVPSTVIEKDGVEVARWIGKVPLSKEFKDIF